MAKKFVRFMKRRYKYNYKKRAAASASRSVKRRRTTAVRNSVRLGKGFPKRVTMTHKFCHTVLLTATAGAVNDSRISCNGMYQPTASASHQPMFFDQMTEIYNHYCVIGSKIRIQATPTAPDEPINAAIWINDDTVTTPTTIDAIVEQNSASHVLIPNDASKTYNFVKKWSMKKNLGVKNIGADLVTGNSAANPGEQSYYQFSFASPASATVAMYVSYEVEYIAVWTEPKDIAQS